MKKESKYVNTGLDLIRSVSPEIAEYIVEELDSQRSSLKMIASENYCSLPVQAAMGTLLTDKYAEGYAGHRFYAGCETIDKIESLGCKTACKLFNVDHANIQPHCGADANMQAYWAVLNAKVLTPNFEEFKKENPDIKTYSDLTKTQWNKLRKLCHDQRLLGMDYYCGGHLTHGYRQNISAQLFETYSYGVDENGFIDYDAIREQALKIKPLILLAGYSAYPRKIDFHKMADIAKECGAVLMVDMAHFAGLVAGKVFTGDYNPCVWADIITTTTHKTLKGPRGGMILCKQWLADSVDKGCPLTMGGPLPHVMAAKTIALIEASKPEFFEYAHQIVKNSRCLGEFLKRAGATIQTDGTDNHIVLLDVAKSYGMNGRQAEIALRKCGITCNRNALPNDPNGPWYTSGIRLGTAALTTLGMKETEMEEIAETIDTVLRATKTTGKSKADVDPYILLESETTVDKLLRDYPLYPNVKIKK